MVLCIMAILRLHSIYRRWLAEGRYYYFVMHITRRRVLESQGGAFLSHKEVRFRATGKPIKICYIYLFIWRMITKRRYRKSSLWWSQIKNLAHSEIQQINVEVALPFIPPLRGMQLSSSFVFAVGTRTYWNDKHEQRKRRNWFITNEAKQWTNQTENRNR